MLSDARKRRESRERPRPEQWPPPLPIQPSLYHLRLQREHSRVMRAEGGRYSGEDDEGRPLASWQLDILQAIAGGAPVDTTDPGCEL